MTSYARVFLLLLTPALALPFVGEAGGKASEELDEAEIFIEFNSTDQDIGIQFFWDGDEWDRMRVRNPTGKVILQMQANKGLASQGLTEGFFESGEPKLSQVPLSEFFGRFPEGTYSFQGVTLDGEVLEGEDELTHVLPAAPANLFPPDGATLSAGQPLTVRCDAVTKDLQGNPLVPELYELVLEDENGLLRVLSMIVPGDEPNPAMTVPPQFLKPGIEYKLEVIVQEESGNRTISEIEFTTV